MLARSVLLLSLIGAALANSHGSSKYNSFSIRSEPAHADIGGDSLADRHAHLAARDAVLGAGRAEAEGSLFERALGDSSDNDSGHLKLAKRSSCSRASQCKSKLKANAVHKCLSGHCAQGEWRHFKGAAPFVVAAEC